MGDRVFVQNMSPDSDISLDLPVYNWGDHSGNVHRPPVEDDDDTHLLPPVYNWDNSRPNYQGAQGAARPQTQDDDIHLLPPAYDWSRGSRRN